jgi:hypothetical protein
MIGSKENSMSRFRDDRSYRSPAPYAQMKQVPPVMEGDTRSVEQRIKDLPNIREEEYPEWKEWADYSFGK